MYLRISAIVVGNKVNFCLWFVGHSLDSDAHHALMGMVSSRIRNWGETNTSHMGITWCSH